MKKKTNHKANNKNKKIFYNALMIICIIVFIVSAFFLGKTLYGYYASKKEYVEVSKIVKEQEKKKLSDEDIFKTLKETNSDTVAYMTIEGTEINYPVVKGTDNSYYLNHTFKKTSNSGGAIFMDYENSSLFLDNNTIFYGHNMKDGSMFAKLQEFRNKEYLKNHKTIKVIAEDRTLTYEVFMCSLYYAEDAYRIKTYDSTGFSDLFYLMRSKAVSSTTNDITVNDKLLTLSTCTYDYDDARLVLHARLIKEKPFNVAPKEEDYTNRPINEYKDKKNNQK